jgi:phage major head subunit gpT-like protein
MLDRAKMRAASQTFKLVYWKTLQSGGVQTPEVQEALKLLMEIPEADWKGLYRWFLGLPIMRQWIGDRQAVEVQAEGFEVIHKPYEATLQVLRDDLKFDKLGGYRPVIAEMANELMLLKFRELVRFMEDARAGTVYGNAFDGYPLISASHPTGSNLGTAALAAASLSAAIVAMKQQADPTTGDRLLVRPTHLWYHPDLAETVDGILNSELVIESLATGGTTDYVGGPVKNVHYKKLLPLEIPMGSSYAAYWGLFADRPGSELGPILWQYDPAGGDFEALDSPDAERNFMRRELLFGTESWGAIAAGFPQFIWGSDGTT